MNRFLHSTVRALKHRVIRTWLLAIGHTALFLGAYYCAFLLRYDFALTETGKSLFEQSVWCVVLVKLGVFYFAGHFHGWWRYVTFSDLVGLIRASMLSLLVLVALDHFLLSYQIPRGCLVLDCLVTILLVGILRSSWRFFDEQLKPWLTGDKSTPALLVCGDEEVGLFAHRIRSHAQSPYRIKGLLDPTGEFIGRRFGTIPVVGELSDVRKIAKLFGIADVLVISGALPGPQMRELMESCEEAGINLRVLPAMRDIFSGDRQIPMRKVEINDLLRREPVQLDVESIRTLLRGRTVLVTGAGGSIGSEICRQVCRFGPEQLILVGRGENRIFKIDRELREQKNCPQIHCCIASITDETRIRQIFEQHRPHVVFHAAAHKHVPLMEINVCEAVKNNVFGAKIVADMAREFKAACFVQISTDKAVNPGSVMGVTKQIAERYMHALSQESTTRFVVVRFGNVLGSDGSVVPIFQEQIRRGGPITVTDSRMTRYFMTIPEASQLVLQAASMGRGGEIFVLEMGKPVLIVDLARDLIRLSGLPQHAVEIVYTGIRPGEKLFEELSFDEEPTLETKHPKLRAVYHRDYAEDHVQQALEQLAHAVQSGDDAQLRAELMRVVPEFRSAESPTTLEPQANSDREAGDYVAAEKRS